MNRTPDFYLDEYALAAYFEKDWFDHVVATGAARPGRFAFAPFPMTELYSPHHERFADLVASKLVASKIAPRSVLEIGSSTGRTFFELRRRLPSLERATLVEPSARLREVHAKIFGARGANLAYFPALRGNGELTEVKMDVARIRAACAGVATEVLGVPFADLPDDLGRYDLVVCANVIDQCHEPLRLVDLLRRSTAPGGLVALSCTYQWQAKYRGLPAEPIRHLDQLFPDGWDALGEADLPFQLRVNERHWMTFLSHVVLFRSNEAPPRHEDRRLR